MSLFKTSPQPWGAGDKHAFLYDAEGNCIANFNTDAEKWPQGSKSAVDLTNRNRAAGCVNALVGIETPKQFVMIAKMVAKMVANGDLPPAALKSVLDGDEVWAVRGVVRDLASPKIWSTLSAQTLSDAMLRGQMYTQADHTVSVIYIPTDKVVL